jgi:hypothetical protein
MTASFLLSSFSFILELLRLGGYSLSLTKDQLENLFTPEVLTELLPADRADRFFEALFGDSGEGAFDLGLSLKGYRLEEKKLHMEIRLKERPGKCLACNLTYGLPQVLSRHPVINMKGLVHGIEQTLGNRLKCTEWSLDHTRAVSRHLHVIPLTLTLEG